MRDYRCQCGNPQEHHIPSQVTRVLVRKNLELRNALVEAGVRADVALRVVQFAFGTIVDAFKCEAEAPQSWTGRSKSECGVK